MAIEILILPIGMDKLTIENVKPSGSPKSVDSFCYRRVIFTTEG